VLSAFSYPPGPAGLQKRVIIASVPADYNRTSMKFRRPEGIVNARLTSAYVGAIGLTSKL